jgi:excinuclease UvrABC helicase subunit UvrB
MKRALDETRRRRAIQEVYNKGAGHHTDDDREGD